MSPRLRWGLFAVAALAIAGGAWALHAAQPPPPLKARHVVLEHHPSSPARSAVRVRTVRWAGPPPSPGASALHQAATALLAARPPAGPTAWLAPPGATVENAAGDLLTTGATLPSAWQTVHGRAAAGSARLTATVLPGINGQYPMPAVGMPRGTPNLVATAPDVAVATGQLQVGSVTRPFTAVLARLPRGWVVVTWGWTRP